MMEQRAILGIMVEPYSKEYVIALYIKLNSRNAAVSVRLRDPYIVIDM